MEEDNITANNATSRPPSAAAGPAAAAAAAAASVSAVPIFPWLEKRPEALPSSAIAPGVPAAAAAAAAASASASVGSGSGPSAWGNAPKPALLSLLEAGSRPGGDRPALPRPPDLCLRETASSVDGPVRAGMVSRALSAEPGKHKQLPLRCLRIELWRPVFGVKFVLDQVKNVLEGKPEEIPIGSLRPLTPPASLEVDMDIATDMLGSDAPLPSAPPPPLPGMEEGFHDGATGSTTGGAHMSFPPAAAAAAAAASSSVGKRGNGSPFFSHAAAESSNAAAAAAGGGGGMGDSVDGTTRPRQVPRPPPLHGLDQPSSPDLFRGDVSPDSVAIPVPTFPTSSSLPNIGSHRPPSPPPPPMGKNRHMRFPASFEPSPEPSPDSHRQQRPHFQSFLTASLALAAEGAGDDAGGGGADHGDMSRSLTVPEMDSGDTLMDVD